MHRDRSGAQRADPALGREPTLLRPPYGHLAGSTLLAANDLGYQVVLWNRQMLESRFTQNPDGLVDYIVESCDPGTYRSPTTPGRWTGWSRSGGWPR